MKRFAGNVSNNVCAAIGLRNLSIKGAGSELESPMRSWIVVILLLCFSPLTALGQFLSGIEGTVHDSSGATVVGARVTIVDNRLQVSRTATTNDAGYFRIDSIAQSTYTVKIELGGFKTWEQKELAIEPGKILTIAP